MIAILLAEGFEEIEALTPLDMLRRAGLDVKTVSITNEKTVTGAHAISVIADLCCTELDLSSVDLVIFPGGMPGAKNLDESSITDKIIEAVNKNSGRFAAICAAPLILGRRGMLTGKKACCYPGFEKELIGADVLEVGCVTDGNITTARGMDSALDFSEELIAILCGNEFAKKLSNAIMR